MRLENSTVKVVSNPQYLGLPAVVAATVGNGVVTLQVGPQPSYYPYIRTIVLALTDQNPCGPRTNCSSAGASVTMDLAGG